MKYLLLALALLSTSCAPSLRFTGTTGFSLRLGSDWERTTNAGKSPAQFEGVTWKDKANKTFIVVEAVDAVPAEMVLQWFGTMLEMNGFVVGTPEDSAWVAGSKEINGISPTLLIKFVVVEKKKYTFILRCQGAVDFSGTDPCEAPFRSFKAE